MYPDKNIRIRNNAKIRPLNISKEKIDTIKKVKSNPCSGPVQKRNIIKRVTGLNPCCVCLGIPSVELYFKARGIKVVEYYCDSCLKTVFEREKLEPTDKDELANYYGCINGDWKGKEEKERLEVSA